MANQEIPSKAECVLREKVAEIDRQIWGAKSVAADIEAVIKDRQEQLANMQSKIQTLEYNKAQVIRELEKLNGKEK